MIEAAHVTLVAIGGKLRYLGVPDPFPAAVADRELSAEMFHFIVVGYAKQHVALAREFPRLPPGPDQIPRAWVLGWALSSN